MNHRLTALLLSALFAVLIVSNGCNEQRGGSKTENRVFAISADSADSPKNDELLKLLYPNDPKAVVDFCKPILVDGKKYFFVQASHGFFTEGEFLYGFIDHHFVSNNNGALQADISVTDTDTTFWGSQNEYEMQSVKYDLVTIGNGNVAYSVRIGQTNQGFWENYTLFLIDTDRIMQLFSIESSFDNTMWFPDNPTVYNNEVKIIDNKQDMFDILVTHKTYDVIFHNKDEFDYDTKVLEQTETRYVYSPIELKYVEK